VASPTGEPWGTPGHVLKIDRKLKDGGIITSGICPAMGRDFKGMQDGTPKLMEMLVAELKQAK
jgi:hypothetical protein